MHEELTNLFTITSIATVLVADTVAEKMTAKGGACPGAGSGEEGTLR